MIEKEISKTEDTLAVNLENKTSGQTTHLLSLAIAQILEKATSYECPVVIEKLDFSSKKAGLREGSKPYAKMLSQFAYSKFAPVSAFQSQTIGNSGNSSQSCLLFAYWHD